MSLRTSDRRHWCGNLFPCLPLGEGGSRVPRKRETDEGKKLGVKTCAYIPILHKCFGSGSSGGNVLVPARTLRRSRLKGRCRKAAPVRKHWINWQELWADLFRPLFIRKSGKYIQYSSAFSALIGRKISRSQLLPIYPVLPSNPPAAPPEALQKPSDCIGSVTGSAQINGSFPFR